MIVDLSIISDVAQKYRERRAEAELASLRCKIWEVHLDLELLAVVFTDLSRGHLLIK